MRHLVVPTAVAGIHFLAAVACMCSDAADKVVAAVVLVLPDIHFSIDVGAATDAVVGVVATVSVSDAGSAIVAVSMVAGAVAAGVATWVLSDDVISTPVVCPVQTCPSTSFFVIVHPCPDPVPSGNVLCCALMHAPSYMWVSSLLTLGSLICFWHDGGQLYPSWSTSYPQEKQYSTFMCCFSAFENAFLVLLALRRSPMQPPPLPPPW